MLAADMKPHAMSLLSTLQQYPSSSTLSKQVDAKELVNLYRYSLDLHPFDLGHKVATYLLQKHKEHLAPHTASLQQWLGAHEAKFLSLVQLLLLPNDKLSEPITAEMLSSAKGNLLSVEETLIKLYECRGQGDFEIKIKGSKTAERVHSYVLYANWPYFRAMYDTGLKEKREGCLELPGVGEDGGMALEVLQLLIELCYKPDMPPQDLKKRLNAAVAMHVLSAADLYSRNHEDGSDGVLDKLVELADTQVANGLTLDVCINVFKQATSYGLDEIAERAREMISQNIKALLADPKHRKEIRSLPSDMQWDLVWTCLAK
jgi:hypothetical protein